jgi:FkbM family methyltransferase
MVINEHSRDIDVALTPFGKVLFPTNDAFIGQSLSLYGEWAKKEIDFICSFIEPNACVIDAGSFIGTHALAFAKATGSSGQVFAFEPQPDYFEVLQQNLSLNNVEQVKAICAGLADSVRSHVSSRPDLSKLGSFGGLSLRNNQDADQITLSLVTIDSLKLPRCDLIKIDVEGMEVEVVRGAVLTLKAYNPLVYAECNSADDGWPVVLQMRSLGYLCFLHSETSFNADNLKKNTENIFGDARELGLLFVHEKDAKNLSRLSLCLVDIIRVESLDDLVSGLLKKPQYKSEVLSKTSGCSLWGQDYWRNETEFGWRERYAVEQALESSSRRWNEQEHAYRDKVGQLERFAESIQLEKNSVISRLEENVRISSEGLSQAKQEIVSLKKQVERVSADLLHKEGENSRVSAMLSKSESDANGLRSALSSANDVITKVSAELALVYGSQSWRLTKPLRITKQWLSSFL